LRLGNLDAKRDWGYARDYVEAMWLMLQQDEPDDYVIATGRTHSVKDFLKGAFDSLGLNYENYVVIDEDLRRPAEVHELKGDARKAEKALGWTPSVKFEELIDIMAKADLDRIRDSKEAALPKFV